MVRLIKGENDLATLNPVLAKEWHPTENGNLKPEDVTPGSGKEVWWLCPEGHPYRMVLINGQKEATVVHIALVIGRSKV